MYIISACLLGRDCRYDGGNKKTEWVTKFADTHSCCAVCPESLGGLTIPRKPCEKRSDGHIRNSSGEDFTGQFSEGASEAYRVVMDEAEVRGEKIEGAILKVNSPSCGAGTIYDGTSKKTVPGDGVFAKILEDHGIRIITEKENIDD